VLVPVLSQLSAERRTGMVPELGSKREGFQQSQASAECRFTPATPTAQEVEIGKITV
jgi:hypothetical protein